MLVFVDNIAGPLCLQDMHLNIVLCKDGGHASHLADVLDCRVFEPTQGNLLGVRPSRPGKAGRTGQIQSEPSLSLQVRVSVVADQMTFSIELGERLEQALPSS